MKRKKVNGEMPQPKYSSDSPQLIEVGKRKAEDGVCAHAWEWEGSIEATVFMI